MRPQAPKNSTRQGAVFGLPKKSVIASQSAPRSKCPWGTDWRGNPSHLRAGCHTRLQAHSLIRWDSAVSFSGSVQSTMVATQRLMLLPSLKNFRS